MIKRASAYRRKLERFKNVTHVSTQESYRKRISSIKNTFKLTASWFI